MLEAIQMAKKDERYCLQKLIECDPLTKMETWKITSWCHDDEDLLNLFLGENYRIFDMLQNKEIRRNVDMSKWVAS